jgi:hypothetical protein
MNPNYNNIIRAIRVIRDAVFAIRAIPYLKSVQSAIL